MSQQQDDDGTVIRPATAAPAGSAAVASAGRTAEARSFGQRRWRVAAIGARLGEFEITRRIGEGGFGIVYLAMDHSLERTVALKEYMPSSLATRVGHDAGAATLGAPSRHVRSRHARASSTRPSCWRSSTIPSLVKVYRFWEANGTAYMVMPFYEGVTLKDALRAMPGPPDEAWLMTLLAPLTEALAVIHAEHCYHRDIAPGQRHSAAGRARPLLLDFGAARRVIGDMTQALTVILKPGYAPVEQYAEVPGMKQGPWTDVYALAAVVYWAITGETPPRSVGRMLRRHVVPSTRAPPAATARASCRRSTAPWRCARSTARRRSRPFGRISG